MVINTKEKSKEASKNATFSVYPNVYISNEMIPEWTITRHTISNVLHVLQSVCVCAYRAGYKAEFDAVIIRESQVVAIVEVKASYVPLYHGVMNVYKELFGSDQVYVWREKGKRKILAVPSKREHKENRGKFITFAKTGHVVGVAFIHQKNQSRSMREYAQASVVSRSFKRGMSFEDVATVSEENDVYSLPPVLDIKQREQQCQHFWMKKQFANDVHEAAALGDSGGDVQKFLANALRAGGFERWPLQDAGMSLLQSVHSNMLMKCAAQAKINRATILARLETLYKDDPGDTTVGHNISSKTAPP